MANNWLELLLRVPIIFILDYSFSFLYDHLKSIMPWYFALFVQVSCKFYFYVQYHTVFFSTIGLFHFFIYIQNLYRIASQQLGNNY